MKNLQYLNKYYYKYRWRLLLGILFVTASNYYAIRIPQKIRDSLNFAKDEIHRVKPDGGVVNEELINTLGYELFIFGLIIIFYMVVKGVFMFLMRQTIIVVSRLIEYDMRKEIYEHLQLMDTAFFKSSRTGDLMARISEDVSKVRNYLGPAILYGLTLVTLFIMTIIAMLMVSPKLTLYTLIPLPFLSISIYYVSDLINKKSSIIQKQVSNLTTIAQEVFSGIRVVKSYGTEAKFIEHFTEQSEDFRQKNMDMSRVNAYFFPLMILLINFSTLIVLYVGGLLVETNEISTANIAEFIIYVNMLTWPVTSIGWIASIVQEAEASQARINELLSQKSKLVNGTYNPTQLNGNITFENVTFTYEDTGVQALKNLSFEIKQGQKIGIVGRTAAGKSTIAELLLRMYDVTEGRILLDGRPINEFNRDIIRKKIGYVPQDVFLFSDNVYNNIAFGIENHDKKNIELFADHASVKEDILRLPKGFDTIVGERGVTLSGGQKQRISIARALIKNPDIIIMDDCLSAVDTETEQKILTYLRDALKGKTSIIITHRLTSLGDCDQIFMLDDNGIVEAGTHEELMARNGMYAELYEMSSLSEV